jgi:hypothetical protein
MGPQFVNFKIGKLILDYDVAEKTGYDRAAQ